MSGLQVEASRVDDIDGAGAPPGAFEFYSSGGKENAGMFYICPCGCGRIGVLAFKPAPSPSWQWNGDRDKPTLSPSIHDMPGGKTHWHGFLRSGIWESC